MVIGIVAAISAILSAAICVWIDSFAKVSWLWMFPLSWLGCFLGVILLAFLMVLVMCTFVDLEKEETKINYIRKERLVGGCKRSFFVGKRIKQEDITAAFKDGVLSIIINNPEKSVEREERKLISIK